MDHDWKQVLHPGQSFTIVPVAMTRVAGGLESAFSTLTNYRRQIMRPYDDNEILPIIFIDHMNCLMGDPNDEKVAALLDPWPRREPNTSLLMLDGRFQRDYRYSKVRTWMDTVIHNLVINYGVGYFNFDYNIDVTQGTDIGGSFSTGTAHLEHQRAYLV
ncbi:hypothetical protein PENCOP_c009G08744 [Penicillium coprophilum]|uniref:alpha-galactosidase n=1 Tax=Penicillium coprophilum TaxID=36646 RepID=A0A1V6UHJ9_9EURO|nr:hypothetical protein PENCOP_c009G08744 [Penicillium coprophilum]